MTVLEIKAAVRERDGNRCVLCGMTAAEHIEKHGRNLDVHRKTPGSPYSIEGTETLCRTCHGPQPRSPRGKCGTIVLNLGKRTELLRRLIEQAEAEDRTTAWQVLRVLNIHFRLSEKTSDDAVSGYEDKPRLKNH